MTAPHEGGEHELTRRRAKSFERLDLTQSSGPPAEQLAGRTKWSRALAPRTASGQRQTSQWPRDEKSRDRSLCKARSFEETVNDPSAGSPTETLLRLLLPLNAQVWSTSRQQGRIIRSANSPWTSLKRSIGSSDGRCVQRAGT